MKRVLIDYKKLDHKVAAVLIDSFPHGYGDDDITTIKKPNGEIIEAVEVRTEDTIYLVKISKSLHNFISNFEDVMEKELDKNEHTKDSLGKQDEHLLNSELESETDLETGDLY